MARSRRIAGSAIALCACAAAWAVVMSSTVARTQVDPASRAIAYLQSQQSPRDGSIPASFSLYSTNALYAMAAAAAGYDPNAMHAGSGPSVMQFLAAHVAAECATAGGCAYLIQAAVAAGDDPRSFAGSDLVSTVEHAFNASSGAYADGGIYTQALALQALVAASTSVPANAVTYLARAQDSDGGWSYSGQPNAATSDTNDTAMALMALDAAADHERDATALAYLRTQQRPPGGFRLQPGTAPDPDSTALVIQAIAAAGQDPSSSAWSDGDTPLQWLSSYQDADGGYSYGLAPPSDTFTTSQVPFGLLEMPFPVKAFHARGFSVASEAQATLHALLYLQTQQSGGGGFQGSGSDLDPLEEYAIAAAADGFDPNVLRNGHGESAIAYLNANARSACASAGACGRLLQAVEAAGLNAHSFGGIDIVATLESFYDSASGAYGNGYAFTQSLAIQGLTSAGVTPPVKAVVFLLGAQDSDGGWNYLDIKDSARHKNGAPSDTNDTAMALMALDGAGVHSADSAALQWLKTQQRPGGGFWFASGSPVDPDSTALVLQAILGAGGDPASPTWVNGGGDLLTALTAMQLPDGGFAYPPSTSADAFTTAEVPLALERGVFPINFRAHRYYTPGTVLSGSAPPTTATPEPRPTATPPAGLVTPQPASGGTSPASAPRSAAATAAPSSRPTPAATSANANVTPPASPAPTPASASPAEVLPRPAAAPLPLIYVGAGLAAAALAAGGSWLVLRRR